MKTVILASMLIAVLFATAVALAKPVPYACAVTPDAASSTPTVVSLHVTGTVPNNADPYLRIDGSQEWTGLHNQRGLIDDWTGRTTAELPAGTTHMAEILDMPKGGLANGTADVISTCTFTT